MLKRLKWRWWQYLTLILPIALVGSVAGWYGRIFYTNQQPSQLVEIRENTPQYHYINPLLLVNSPRQAPEYATLKNTIAAYISKAKSQNLATDISIYFRDLNSARWIGVDENKLYDPSSTLKVAVMLGYLKLADNNPQVLLKQLPYTKTVDPGQHYPPKQPLASGSYSVRDLIEAMIIDSDNTALAALYQNNHDAFVDVFKSLQLPPPPNLLTLDFMSPKTYSEIFRTLYSSTYLSRNISEQALQLLTYTHFNQGLAAGVPSGTIVAHKFGEHTSVDASGQLISHQLHDCGIVYYPTDPYLLCIMTRGSDFSHLEITISTISQITYQQVSKKT